VESIREAIAALVSGQDLSEEEAEFAMAQILEAKATPVQMGAFLAALQMKGETAAEITGCARAMRRLARPVRPRRTDLVDISGTGGDQAGTFNISSVAACIDTVGIGFLFAPHLHPTLEHANRARAEVGAHTIFDVLGPLTNPAAAPTQVVGVYSAALTEPVAQAMGALGSRAAYVVAGADGIDEFSTTGVNKVSRLEGGTVSTFALDALELGLPRARLSDLLGGSLDENARIARAVLDGEKGPRRDIVLLNAAVTLLAAGRTSDLSEALALAASSIDSGQARQKLDDLVECSRRLGRG
jgi:anthranilate phosphoribosyltransferase